MFKPFPFQVIIYSLVAFGSGSQFGVIIRLDYFQDDLTQSSLPFLYICLICMWYNGHLRITIPFLNSVVHVHPKSSSPNFQLYVSLMIWISVCYSSKWHSVISLTQEFNVLLTNESFISCLDIIEHKWHWYIIY